MKESKLNNTCTYRPLAQRRRLLQLVAYQKNNDSAFFHMNNMSCMYNEAKHEVAPADYSGVLVNQQLLLLL